jgi:hypothetical protein
MGLKLLNRNFPPWFVGELPSSSIRDAVLSCRIGRHVLQGGRGTRTEHSCGCWSGGPRCSALAGSYGSNDSVLLIRSSRRTPVRRLRHSTWAIAVAAKEITIRLLLRRWSECLAKCDRSILGLRSTTGFVSGVILPADAQREGTSDYCAEVIVGTSKPCDYPQASFVINHNILKRAHWRGWEPCSHGRERTPRSLGQLR